MNKRLWILGIAAFVLFLGGAYLLTVSAAKPRMAHIGILLANDTRLAKVEGLQQTLSRLGYLDGQDVTYQVLNAQNDISKLPVLARRLLQEQPDVLVAAGYIEAQSLKDITAAIKSPIPVVFMGTLSPAAIGLVLNPAHPEGNLTGLNNYHLELTTKRLELLHRLLPNMRRVAVLGDIRAPSFERTQAGIQSVTREFSLTLNSFTVSSPEDIERVFQEITAAKVEAIMLLPGFFLETSMEQIVGRALQQNLPVFGVYPGDIKYGCLASYGTSYEDQGAQSAQLVYKILRGQATGDIPVETPDKIVLSVNLRIANKLGIHPAADVLSLADQVIQP